MSDTSPQIPSPKDAPFCVVDIETSGLDARTNEILSIAILLCSHALNPLHTTNHFVALEKPHAADPMSLVICGYAGHEHLWNNALSQRACAQIISQLTRERILIAHNIDFDRAFLASSLRSILESPRWRARQICTLKAMRQALKSGKAKGEGASLQASCARFGIPLNREEGSPHMATDDAEATRQLALALSGLGVIRLI